jgi:histidinol-phosphate phosphatase family protein
MSGALVDVVIPTVGRPQLGMLLRDLTASRGGCPPRVVVVDDRAHPEPPLPVPCDVAPFVEVRRSGGRGPAAARNTGWWGGTSTWVSFLDDDVRLPAGWYAALRRDLDHAPPCVGGVQGHVDVPLPPGRRPTDWERNVHGLERARWVTADMAYRRAALEAVGGFDERFIRAYREDVDLAAAVQDRGWALRRGTRRVIHPVRSAGRWVSVTAQRGNADDALLRARYGPDWRGRFDAPGRFARHLAVVGALTGAAVAAIAGRPRLAAAAAVLAVAGTTELAVARLRGGPLTGHEVATVALTTPLLPVVAVAQRGRGALAVRKRARRGLSPAVRLGMRWPAPRAVLFDRDGTLVVDVPYNGDGARVVPVAAARRALRRLREEDIPVGVVTNQSGVARGVLSPAQVAAVNARVDELLGPFSVWAVCLHGPDDHCRCRKPAPGLVLRAARVLGVDPSLCVVIGDTAADVDAARAAGARGVLVPNPVTRPEEIARAREVASDLAAAVELVLAR